MDTREKLIELEQATVWFEKRAKDTPMPGAKKMFEIGAEALREKVNGVKVQEWISVKDRLPKGGEIVLCNTSCFVEVLQWDERADVWVGQYRSYSKNYVTHWMPLPEPPKGE